MQGRTLPSRAEGPELRACFDRLTSSLRRKKGRETEHSSACFPHLATRAVLPRNQWRAAAGARGCYEIRTSLNW